MDGCLSCWPNFEKWKHFWSACFIRFACLRSVRCCYIDWEMVIFVIPLLYSGRKSGTVRFATFVNLSSLCAYLREGISMFSLWRKHGRDFLVFLWLLVSVCLCILYTLSCSREAFHAYILDFFCSSPLGWRLLSLILYNLADEMFSVNTICLPITCCCLLYEG